MEYRRLGRTDLNVSLICLGTMTWGQQNTEAEGHAQLDYALDQGINFIDTAEMYSIPPRRGDAGLDRADHRLVVQGAPQPRQGHPRIEGRRPFGQYVVP